MKGDGISGQVRGGRIVDRAEQLPGKLPAEHCVAGGVGKVGGLGGLPPEALQACVPTGLCLSGLHGDTHRAELNLLSEVVA